MLATPVYGWPYANRKTDPLTYEIVSGEKALLAIEPTVADIAARVAAVEAKTDELDQDWTLYTPSWLAQSGGTNPTAASHNVTGRWRKIDSRAAVVQFRIVGLTTTGWGVATWYRFGLPFAITSDSVIYSIGSGHVLDFGTNEFPCNVKPDSTTTVRMFSASGGVGRSVPMTFTTNDEITGSIMVEQA
jgi:hypothetical protein